MALSDRSARFLRRARAMAVMAVATSAGLAAASPRAAPAQDPDGRKVWITDDGAVSIPLPASWDVRREPSAPADGGAALSLTIHPDQPGQSAHLWANVRDDVRNARGRLVYELPWHKKDYSATASGRCEHALPNFWTEAAEGAEAPVRRLFAIRHVRRVALTFLLEVPVADWDGRWRPFLDGVAESGTRLDDAPPRPAGLRPVEKGGHLYLLGKGVKNTAVDAFQKRVAAVEASWSAIHGPLPRDPANPLEFVIHATRAETESAHTVTGWGMRSESGIYGLDHAGRMLAWEFEPRDNRVLADFTYALWSLFHSLSFDREPEWLQEAQAYAAWLEVRCGKPLPVVPEGLLERLPADPPRFADLATPELVPTEERGIRKHRSALVGYLAVFRAGPAPCQEAWKAFLAEMRASGDWNRAQKPLLALDQDVLRREMEYTFDKLKRVPQK